MTITEIKELIQAVLESGIAELEVQRNENRVRIVRGGAGGAEVTATGAATGTAEAAGAANGMAGTGAVAAAAEPALDEGLVTIKSPIVGTFYEAPSPGAPLFASVGDGIQPGKVLCIVESMKLMNEIESEISGTIVAKHVNNGEPVEYGTVLFTVRPS